MTKLLGVLVFLLLIYGALLGYVWNRDFDGTLILRLHHTLAQRIGLYGILTLAAGIVIITGNIDLSIGSQVALCSTVFCVLLMDLQQSLAVSVLVTLAVGVLMGSLIGLVVTKLRVQSFIVTLCGMFIFRGVARLITGDKKTGLEDKFTELQRFFLGTSSGIPMFLVILLGVLIVAILFLHFTVYGRYFFAVGSNERAAQFAGVATDRYKILAFVLCSALVAFYSFLFVMEYNSVNPNDTGNMFELYAIAGAVLGGCSLRGGDGTVIGLFLGTCVIVLLQAVTNYWLGILLPREWMTWISIDAIIPVAIGLALLGGAIVDEMLRRRQAKAK